MFAVGGGSCLAAAQDQALSMIWTPEDEPLVVPVDSLPCPFVGFLFRWSAQLGNGLLLQEQ